MIDETFKAVEETINLFTERFNKNVATRQKDMWASIYKTIKNLETDDTGNILATNKNLKTLRTLKGEIASKIITKQYKKDLSRFLGSFDELKDITDTYYKTIASGTLNANKNVFNAVKSLSIDATKNSLLEAGINNEIIAPVESILSQSITSGASITDMEASLRQEILGNSQVLGKLERYSRQITTDSLNQFNANYNKTVSNDLGLNFYYYAGAVKTTSRSYCLDRVSKGRYFHKKEVEQSASESWKGKIPGTNGSTIFVYRGGYNCGHQWLAVDELLVPKGVVQRAKANGYT